MQQYLEKAKRMYTTYCQAVGGKAFNGDDLPKADEFFMDPSKEKQSSAWLAVAKSEAWHSEFPAGMK